MTVTYTAEVATCRGFGCFIKLLLRWRGSVYKLVWMDLIAFLGLYYLLSFLYRTVMSESDQQTFESVVHYCNSYGSLIPLSFVLGFYVSVVMTRWWDQYMSIPWPDPVAVFVSAHVHGQDERGRVMRRTVMRYVCLCLTMVLIGISPRVKKRFPTKDHLVDAGLLVESEKAVIMSFDAKFPKYPKHWMPIVWAASIITRARKEGRIRDDFALKTIIDELNRFRGLCGVLMHYDSISIPLVYTQVVTLAVYTYFLCNCIGQQWTKRPDVDGYYNLVDCYFPIFTTLQFFFYMGWLKVAESMINPFGDDDDDFEVNWIVDRNLQVSYLIVDEMHHEHPVLVRDQYWDEVFPNELPYSKEMEGAREEPPEPSTAKLDKSKNNLTALSHIRIDGADSNIHLNGKSHQSTTNLHSSRSRLSTMVRHLIGREESTHSKKTQREGISSSSSATSNNNNTQRTAPAKTQPILKSSLTKQLKVTDQKPENEEDQQTLTANQQSHIASAHPSVRDLFVKKTDDGTEPPEGGSSSSLQGEESFISEVIHSSHDDFEALRRVREQERKLRMQQKIARTVGNITVGDVTAQTSLAIPITLPMATSTPTVTAPKTVASRTSTNALQDSSSNESAEERKKQEKEKKQEKDNKQEKDKKQDK